MVTARRGDVVLCDLNPVVGTEQAGIRPGSAKGMLIIHAENDEHLKDFKEYMP